MHFGIRTRTGDDPATPPAYSKDAADKYIPKQSRTLILGLIRQGVERVVSAAFPANITMETYYDNLPVRALEKYAPIAGAIIICGYKIADQWRDPESGINYWIFSRSVELIESDEDNK